MKNQVQLITYVDRLSGGGVRDLHALLSGPLRGLFGGVHILPFFSPIDGADAGFDPIDHTVVDARIGTWSDIEALAADYEVMADVIVNHVSRDSPRFLDFSRHGDESSFAGMFLTERAVFPRGASSEDIAAISRPRPGRPFTSVTLENGECRTLWTTFTPQQLDIDVSHPLGAAYLEEILETFHRHRIRAVRLDAIGYAVKKAGTSCFLIPETFEFIDQLTARARRDGIDVLVEVHAHYRKQIEISSHVDWVYDFALPPLILHAFAFRTATQLKRWLELRPRNAITVLDTHDGIGIVDIGADRADHTPGLVPPDELDELVRWIHRNSNMESARASGATASNLDIYQVNCTFYDALGRDDGSYWLARAVQFFVPGIPQVYYVGLLAGRNDMALLDRTGVGRDIGRHYYRPDEIERDLARPVVRDLCALIRIRNTHPAFGGTFTLEPTAHDELRMRWDHGGAFATLHVNFTTRDHLMTFSSRDGEQRFRATPPARHGDDGG